MPERRSMAGWSVRFGAWVLAWGVGLGGGAGCGGGELELGGGAIADGAGWPEGLAADWAGRRVGECRDRVEWWRLRPPGAMEHALQDRAVCGRPAAVRTSSGSMEAVAGRRVELRWGDESAARFERFTAALLGPAAVAAGPEWPAGFRAGGRALNRMAYRAEAGEGGWLREDWRSRLQTEPTSDYGDERLTVRLGVEPALLPGGPVREHRLRLDVLLRVDGGSDRRPQRARLVAELAAESRPLESGWTRLAAAGYGPGVDAAARWRGWLDAEARGPGWTAALRALLAERMRPVFYWSPADRHALFHDLGPAWYVEQEGDFADGVP